MPENSVNLNRSGIYEIVNVVNGKRYIGSSINLKNRKMYHWKALRNNDRKRACPKLLNAWNKYGESKFVFNVIEYVDDKNKLINREQYWLDYYKTYERGVGYNVAPIAGSCYGCHHSQEAISKIREKAIGNTRSRGEKNHFSILTQSRVSEIKKLLEEDNLRMQDIADIYNVSVSCISSINCGDTWGHVAPGFKPRNGYKRGQDCHLAKLTESQVIKIKQMLLSGDKAKAVAKIFNVHPETIRRIRRGVTWNACA